MSISVQGISKSFKGRRKGEPENEVLKDVNFEVEEGQFVSLLGPSGCGKTTTLTIIAGFQKATDGVIKVNGDKVEKPGPDRAFMFQNYALFPWLKVGENIEYPKRKMKIPKSQRKERLRELLEMAQLTEYEHYYIHEISGGMKQRVALLRALACDPKVLLMDEPLSNLDAKLRVEMRTVIKNIQKEVGITTVYVTHDQEEAMAISDRIAVMKDGVIRHCGEPKNIYQRPADLFVATFIGKSNLLSARLTKDGGKTVLAFPNGYKVSMDSVREEESRDRDVTLSVRPEELFVHLYQEGEVREGISARIQDSVFLGSNTHYFAELETGETAEIIQESEIDEIIPPGSRVILTLNSRKANLFDPETTQSLMKGIKNSTDLPAEAGGREVAG